jgi:hypothetical protein
MAEGSDGYLEWSVPVGIPFVQPQVVILKLHGKFVDSEKVFSSYSLSVCLFEMHLADLSRVVRPHGMAPRECHEAFHILVWILNELSLLWWMLEVVANAL